jgi:hypothetical protein
MEAASAVGGLISLGLEITTILNWYITTVNDAPRVAHDLLIELEALSRTLDLFKQKASSETGARWFPETSVLLASTNSCDERLRRLRKILEPLSDWEPSKPKRLLYRVKWPLNEAQTKEEIAAFERLAQVFAFSLQIEGL